MKHKALNLPNLTPLRGIAALIVVMFHFDGMVARLTFSKDSMFLKKSYLMVDMFFIISGFIILHVYGEDFKGQIKWNTYMRFLKARFARIYPLHLFLLLILIIVFYFSLNPYISGPLTDLVFTPWAIPTNLLLLQSFGIHDIFTWNVPSWSISAEWWAYLLFPILALFYARHKSFSLLLMTGVVITLYLLIVYYLPRPKFIWSLPNTKDLQVSYELGYIRGLAGFMTGMITYHLYTNKKLIHFLSNDVIGLVCIIALVTTMNIGLNDLVYIPLLILVVLCVVSNKKLIHRICMLRPLQYLGEISYSIYLSHFILIFCVAMPMIEVMGYDYKGPGSIKLPHYQGLYICSLFLLIVILASTVTYHFIEKPARNLINKKRKNTVS